MRNNKIECFIALLCNDLEIELPKISFDTSFFATKTSMAVVDAEKRILYLKRQLESLDMFFAIAHELRHLWQFEYRPYWFEGYKPADQCSTREYNMQRVEIDANAYALIIMEDEFEVSPRFNGLSADIVAEIEKRADEICLEEYPDVEF